ncbi:hypothetical protein [Streptomyces hawaiiensis]|uniref:hypothetical protein n=1 Tax=Streptomyces hawaiiensis TaxID=67305 RepID=UPI00365495F6
MTYATVELAVRILRGLPTTHPARAPLARRAGECAASAPASTAHLTRLAGDSWRAALRSDETRALDATVTVLETLLAAFPDEHPERAGRLSNHGLALRERYRMTGNADDLEAAARAGRAAVTATPDDPEHRADLADHCHNLTATLTRQHETDPTDDRLRAASTPPDAPTRRPPREIPTCGTGPSTCARCRWSRTGGPGGGRT